MIKDLTITQRVLRNEREHNWTSRLMHLQDIYNRLLREILSSKYYLGIFVTFHFDLVF